MFWGWHFFKVNPRTDLALCLFTQDVPVFWGLQQAPAETALLCVCDMMHYNRIQQILALKSVTDLFLHDAIGQ